MFTLKKPSTTSTNFLEAPQEKKIHRHTILLAVIFTVIVAGVAALGAQASYRAARQTASANPSDRTFSSVFGSIHELFYPSPTTATAETPEEKNRMNVLILGVGGDGHDGSQLTDTILFASIDLQNKKVGMLSLPRDMAYPLGGGMFEKINAVNAYAEQDHPGEGAQYTSDAIAKLLEVRIDHVIKIDFRGFSKLIDAVGGVDLNVERSFVDPQYPTSDDKWTTISFKKGQQHMSGADALVFVRSRHGSNNEGSDFARSRRQQLVLIALREKLLSRDTLTDPSKLADLYQSVNKNIQTDLGVWDMLKLAPLLKDFSSDRISMNVLSDAPDNVLTAATVNGAYMLFPKNPDWSDIRTIAKEPFATATAPAPTQPADISKLEIKNGTTRTGFASQIAAKMEKNGYEVTAFGNALNRGYDRTVLFDLTGGKKATELKKLQKAFNAELSLTTITDDPVKGRLVYAKGMSPERVFSPQAEFLIILGETSFSMIDAPLSFR